MDKTRTKDVIIEESINFDGLLLSANTLNGLTKHGFRKPSPIQLKAIPLGRCGFDLVVKSKSGTGKTAVFTIIALEMLNTKKNALQTLIVAPTREIAVQIAQVIINLGTDFTGLNVATFIGGTPVETDVANARLCHVAVGTPGRLKHLIESGHLSTQYIRLFVLDEADKLMEQNFQGDINKIYHKLPERKQMIAVSATYPDELDKFLATYMLSPTHVSLSVDTPLLLGLRQFVSVVAANSNVLKQMTIKINEIVRILSNVSFTQCLIFSNMQSRAESISNILNRKGWKSNYISAAQSQSERLTALANLKDFKTRILLSTDLTARGIDAVNVDLIINYDVPHEASTYLHRMGRAGRYGSKGICVTLASRGNELEQLQKILGVIGGSNLAISTLPSGESEFPQNLWEIDEAGLEQVQSIVVKDITEERMKLESIKKSVLSLKNEKKGTTSSTDPSLTDGSTMDGSLNNECATGGSLNVEPSMVIEGSFNDRLMIDSSLNDRSMIDSSLNDRSMIDSSLNDRSMVIEKSSNDPLMIDSSLNDRSKTCNSSLNETLKTCNSSLNDTSKTNNRKTIKSDDMHSKNDNDSPLITTPVDDDSLNVKQKHLNNAKVKKNKQSLNFKEAETKLNVDENVLNLFYQKLSHGENIDELKLQLGLNESQSSDTLNKEIIPEVPLLNTTEAKVKDDINSKKIERIDESLFKLPQKTNVKPKLLTDDETLNLFYQKLAQGEKMDDLKSELGLDDCQETSLKSAKSSACFDMTSKNDSCVGNVNLEQNVSKENIEKMKALNLESDMEYSAANKNDDESSLKHKNVVESLLGHENVSESSSGYKNVVESSIGHKNVSESSIGHKNVSESSFGLKNISESPFGLDNSAEKMDFESPESSLGHKKVYETSLGPESVSETSLGHKNAFETSLGPKNVFETSLGHKNVSEKSLGHKNVSEKSLGPESVFESSLGHKNDVSETTAGQENIPETSLEYENIPETSLGYENASESPLQNKSNSPIHKRKRSELKNTTAQKEKRSNIDRDKIYEKNICLFNVSKLLLDNDISEEIDSDISQNIGSYLEKLKTTEVAVAQAGSSKAELMTEEIIDSPPDLSWKLVSETIIDEQPAKPKQYSEALQDLFVNAYEYLINPNAPHWRETIGESISDDEQEATVTEKPVNLLECADDDEDEDEEDENAEYYEEYNVPENYEEYNENYYYEREVEKRDNLYRGSRRNKNRKAESLDRSRSDRDSEKNIQLAEANPETLLPYPAGIYYPHEFSNSEVFTSTISNCGDTFLQNANSCEDEESFNKFFWQWQSQVASVRDYIQQNVYLREMNRYQYYKMNRGTE